MHCQDQMEPLQEPRSLKGWGVAPAGPVRLLTDLPARPLPRLLWLSRPPRARPSLPLRPRRGCSCACPSAAAMSATGLVGSAAVPEAAATAAAFLSPLPLPWRSPLALPRPLPLPSPSCPCTFTKQLASWKLKHCYILTRKSLALS